MPHELALHLDQLDLKVIQLTYNLRTEIILKGGKLLCKINYLHGFPPADSRTLTPTKFTLLDYFGPHRDSLREKLSGLLRSARQYKRRSSQTLSRNRLMTSSAVMIPV